MTSIAIISNYLNHHQLPLCKAFLGQNNIEFKFISTGEMPEFRKKIGYKVILDSDLFELHLYYDEESMKEAKDICEYCDILIEYYGAAEPPVRGGVSHLSGQTEPPKNYFPSERDLIP